MSSRESIAVQDAALISIVEKLRDHGSWTGQTHVQKALFFCQAMLRLPLGFDYILYKHGPYSPKLHRSIHRLQADSALAFVAQTPPYRPRLVTSEGAELIRENEADVLAEYDDALEFAAEALARRSIKELERLATALWFILRRPLATAEEIATLVHARKPHISMPQARGAFVEVKKYGHLARQRGLIELRVPPPPSRERAARVAGPGESLVIDLASEGRRLTAGELSDWAKNRSVFISSDMQALAGHREKLALALRGLGLRVLMFEDLGGLDDDAQRAYLTRVAQADLYVGLVADLYGDVVADQRSPTHEEYLHARRHGKRITFWVAADGDDRDPRACAFVREVRAFHTTGRFLDAEDLTRRVLERVAEIVAEDEAPWIKIGPACLRATRIAINGPELGVTAEVRDVGVRRALERLQGSEAVLKVATADRAGELSNVVVASEYENLSMREMHLRGDVVWVDGLRAPAPASTGWHSADDATEVELRAGLLAEAVSVGLARGLGEIPDPLEPLAGLDLSHSTQQAVAALLMSEALVGTGKATRIDSFALGPAHDAQQQLELLYVEAPSAGVVPGMRRIQGVRPAL